MWTIDGIIRTFRMLFDPLRFIGSMVQYNITNAERIMIMKNVIDKTKSVYVSNPNLELP